MTTIVYRNRILAADSGICDRGLMVATADKIARTRNGWLGGVAGCLGDSAAFMNWLNGNCAGPVPFFKDEESEGILISPQGKIEWIGGGQKRFAISAPFVAIGSGFAVAMGALEAHASAYQAVQIACRLDCHSADPVRVLRLDDEGQGS